MNVRQLRYVSILGAVFLAVLGTAVRAQVMSPPSGKAEPERFRGQVVKVEPSGILLQMEGKTLRLNVDDGVTVFSLTKASYADVDFGKYVGAVSYKLGDHIYSPIIRDSLSWLHRAYELRIIDESLRGIAVGHTKWDLTGQSVMTHGWVDDMEERVISIKYGPTEEEETDVEIARDVPVFRMSLGDFRLIKPGMRIFAGAQRDGAGRYTALFFFVGQDGAVPRL
jgi:hypothetical protein